MKYISNAFSLGMVPRELLTTVRIAPCESPDVHACTSIVGHADTAAVLGVPFNRASVTLVSGDVLYVAQLQGGRLPEGCKALPEGASFAWVKVTV
jgi:hypothetical protein